MGESIPDCPIDPIDRSAMRDYLERQEAIDRERSKLRARTFGKRIFRSGDIRHTISRLTREQAAARSLHPELFTTENTVAYQQWLDTLGDH